MRKAFVARRAIEFRLGLDLEMERGRHTFVESPQEWINDIFRIAEVGDPTAPGTGTGVDLDLVDYVDRLRLYVESYPFDHPFTDGLDVAVISLRDDVVRAEPLCGVATDPDNRVRWSEDLARTPAWQATEPVDSGAVIQPWAEEPPRVEGSYHDPVLCEGQWRYQYVATDDAAPGQSYTFSVWVAPATATDQQFGIGLWFLGEGNVGPVWHPLPAASGWQRVELTVDRPGSGGGYVVPIVASLRLSDSTPFAFYAWGAQLERADHAGSYHPTMDSTMVFEPDDHVDCAVDLDPTGHFLVAQPPTDWEGDVFRTAFSVVCVDGTGPTPVPEALARECTIEWLANGLVRCAGDDGAWCDGDEFCDPVLDCRLGTPADCDDEVACTDATCDEDADRCAVELYDERCADDITCTLETCDATAGCLSTPHDEFCDDGVACTVDVCNPELGCQALPDDLLCPAPAICHSSRCDLAAGCIEVVEPDGTGCDVLSDIDEICVTGLCIPRGCGDGFVDATEECDPPHPLVGCAADCTTTDFVVSDVSPSAGDDGREELGPADHTVAVLSDGKLVVAWTQDQDDDPSYADIMIRAIDPATGIIGGDVVVTGDAMFGGAPLPQERPVMAAFSRGGLVVAWQGYGADPDGEDVDIYFAICDAPAAVVRGEGTTDLTVTCGDPILANTTVGEAQLNPTVAILPGMTDETFVLAWEDWSRYGETGDPWDLSGIRYRLFMGDGTPAPGFDSDALANSTTIGAQAEPSVAALSTGGFLIAWSDGSETETADAPSGSAIRARVFGAGGAVVGTGGTSDPALDFVVNTRVQYEQYEPSVAAVEMEEPGWVVAWTDMEVDGRLTVRGNFIFADGSFDGTTEVVFPHAVVPPPTPRPEEPSQFAPSLASDGERMVAIWVEEPRGTPRLADVSSTAISGVRLGVTCEGGPCRAEVISPADVLLNTTTFDAQETPSAAFGGGGPSGPGPIRTKSGGVSGTGPLAIVWTDWSGADGSGGLDEVRARYLPAGWVLE
ncbi:MAG: hypothetical protein HY905_14370 [Deltaproteobacteria bacterium]|nr:hypothetical protein [Deltaproteobacteria bacterium]